MQRADKACAGRCTAEGTLERMITVVFNIFLTPGKVLWQWGILHVTEEGQKLAGRMAIRLTYLVIGSSLMTLTTTPN